MTITDIAHLAGVSPSTVSRALDDSSLISHATKERIQKIAQAHSYRPHLGARNLRLKQSNSIVLVLPLDFPNDEILSNPFVLKFAGSIASALRDYGYDLLVSRLTSAGQQIDDCYIHSGLADGAILLGRGKSEQGKIDPDLSLLVSTGIPFVVWGPTYANQPYCSVGIDNCASAAAAVRHLAALGRRHIGIIADALDDPFTESYLRYQGYLQAISELRMPYDEKLVAHATYAKRSGGQAVRRLLQTAPYLDALFVAHSDVVAIGAMQALHEAGLHIPKDVAVIGFDNIDSCEFTTPTLTSISQQLEEGGARLLVEKLMQQITGKQVESVMMQAKLVVRQSCGAHLMTS